MTSFCNGAYFGGKLVINAVTSLDVMVAIRSLKPKTSLAFDDVLAFTVNGCANLFIGPLEPISHLFLEQRGFPERGKI